MPSTQVSTSATTTSVPQPPQTPSGIEVRYTTTDPRGSSYTVKPHPPTPRP